MSRTDGGNSKRRSYGGDAAEGSQRKVGSLIAALKANTIGLSFGLGIARRLCLIFLMQVLGSF